MADSCDGQEKQLLREIHDRLDGVESRLRRLAEGGRMTKVFDLMLQVRYEINQAVTNHRASPPDATGS